MTITTQQTEVTETPVYHLQGLLQAEFNYFRTLFTRGFVGHNPEIHQTLVEAGLIQGRGSVTFTQSGYQFAYDAQLMAEYIAYADELDAAFMAAVDTFLDHDQEYTDWLNQVSASQPLSQPTATCQDICPQCGYPADLNGDAVCVECQHPEQEPDVCDDCGESECRCRRVDGDHWIVEHDPYDRADVAHEER